MADCCQHCPVQTPVWLDQETLQVRGASHNVHQLLCVARTRHFCSKDDGVGDFSLLIEFQTLQHIPFASEKAHSVLGTAAAAEQTFFSSVCALRRKYSLRLWGGTTSDCEAQVGCLLAGESVSSACESLSSSVVSSASRAAGCLTPADRSRSGLSSSDELLSLAERWPSGGP